MEGDFLALLRADANVTALAGNRINFGEHPQGEPHPAIVLQTISSETDMHMNGSGGLETARVQVDCIADTYRDAKYLARAVNDAIHFYRGGGFFLINQIAARDSRETGSNEAERLFRTSLDFNTAWRPTE